MNLEMPPPPEDPRDSQNLRLLTVLHYVWAALSAVGAIVFGGMFVFVVSMLPGIMEQAAAQNPSGAAPPKELIEMMRWVYGAMGAVYFVGGITLSILSLLTAMNLTSRRRRTFCMVASGIQCLAVPLGTALGVPTLILLTRESVARRFDAP